MQRRSFIGSIVAALCSPIAMARGALSPKNPWAMILARKIKCYRCGELIHPADLWHIKEFYESAEIDFDAQQALRIQYILCEVCASTQGPAGMSI